MGDRRIRLMLGIVCTVYILYTVVIGHGVQSNSNSDGKRRLNVLFLMADDLRPQLGCYSGTDAPAPVSTVMHTPHLDHLASRSLLFQRAYAQVATCNPSRSSALTGRRPNTTHVYDNAETFRPVRANGNGGNFTTIPQYFKDNGYLSLGMGKIFHGKKNLDTISWSEPFYKSPNSAYWSLNGKKSWDAVQPHKRRQIPLPDDQIAEKAIHTLRRVAPAAKNGKQPFFLAVGFRKPHLPFVCPKEMFDYYPMSEIDLPNNPYAPVDMPSAAWNPSVCLFRHDDIELLNVSSSFNTTNALPQWKVKQLRRAYYACVTYIDELVGRIIEELRMLDLEDDTIVSFWGDHGWQLGEHGLWTKQTNFELATRVPFMIHIPGKTNNGAVTYKLTEMVDLFPTLVEAAGLPSLPLCQHGRSTSTALCTEGTSVMPLVDDPSHDNWKSAAFSQFLRLGENTVMGYSVRTKNHRYTEWPRFRHSPNHNPDWSELHGVELYDHTTDAEENVNRAGHPKYSEIQRELRAVLRQDWRLSMPHF